MLRNETQVIHGGTENTEEIPYVSPPLYRGSTVLFDSLADLQKEYSNPFKNTGPVYGRFGNPNSRQFESVLNELEGGFGSVCTVSGLAAITTAILALVQSGDHILVSDSVYFPTRTFCDTLSKFGIEVEYYDPCAGAELAERFRPRTKLVYLESPGSITFELQDVPSIAKICQARGVFTLLDNTWGTPLYFQPLKLGINASIHSGTKYLTGHADSFLGVIICDEKTYPLVRGYALDLGQKAGSDDVFMALRGLKTLAVRLQQHGQAALQLAAWLETQPEVAKVLHPGLPSHPQHALWKRDFTGSCGLFAFELQESFSKASLDVFFDSLQIFALGASWGGYESLAIPGFVSPQRKFLQHKGAGPMIRLHVGLEHVQDLQQDLAQALRSLGQTRSK